MINQGPIDPKPRENVIEEEEVKSDRIYREPGQDKSIQASIRSSFKVEPKFIEDEPKDIHVDHVAIEMPRITNSNRKQGHIAIDIKDDEEIKQPLLSPLNEAIPLEEARYSHRKVARFIS